MANGFTIPNELKINLGKYPNDGTGDDLYTAFDKIVKTFNLINSELGITTAENVGTSGVGVFSAKVDNKLQFKKLTGSSGITITNLTDTIDIAGLASVEGDTSPNLGGNLNLNTFNVIGAGNLGVTGDVRATVWGIDMRDINDQVQTLYSNTGLADLDLGSFVSPASGVWDLGTF
jgi:hypothetical protein